ncbi:MAG TPA: LLM class flavin-dependent oxidoreductase [Rhodopila sp.]|uniref:LLM class flavin-dependent oxidoreductase n=1 Tax=Rhodopila sp. TaxID=2480087 RepID=UPI002BF972E4|nr:LLM class flavin-dependent oxidoreductase [Rhodopila sp.]HVY16378.1 LLM class flavin-dependent oxidoreductase [Rhodopila sp.]
MSLALLFGAAGSHPASWLHRGSRLAPPTDLAAYVSTARTAERGLFDLFFIADTPAARTENLHVWSRFPLFMNVLEPVTLLTAVAGATSRIGLGGTVSTSFSEPYNVARQFASLDHLSGGRAAWNVVTSANDYAARNFGHAKLAPHAERYRRAGEFVDVVRRLWDSWDDGAFVLDRDRGLYFDPAAQHAVHHDGAFFKVDGALNIARPPQGHPVIIAAGASDTGQDLAARTAEVVFSSNPSIEAARDFTQGLKARMARFGRAPSEMKVLAGLPIVLAETDAEAADDYARLQELVHPDVGRYRLGMDLETDLSDLPLDEPIPEDRIPKSANFHKGFFDDILRLIRDGNPTLREVYLCYERGRKTITGGPNRIADVMEDWFTSGAADGFMLQFHIMPRGLDLFVERVVPELQRRGLMRSAYAGATLRDHLGLRRPSRGERNP